MRIALIVVMLFLVGLVIFGVYAAFTFGIFVK